MTARETKTPEQLVVELLTTGQSMTHGVPDAERLLGHLRRDWAAEDRAAVLRGIADHAESLRQFEHATGARASAQVSENLGILRVADDLRRLADEAEQEDQSGGVR